MKKVRLPANLLTTMSRYVDVPEEELRRFMGRSFVKMDTHTACSAMCHDREAVRYWRLPAKDVIRFELKKPVLSMYGDPT